MVMQGQVALKTWKLNKLLKQKLPTKFNANAARGTHIVASKVKIASEHFSVTVPYHNLRICIRLQHSIFA